MEFKAQDQELGLEMADTSSVSSGSSKSSISSLPKVPESLGYDTETERTILRDEQRANRSTLPDRFGTEKPRHVVLEQTEEDSEDSLPKPRLDYDTETERAIIRKERKRSALEKVTSKTDHGEKSKNDERGKNKSKVVLPKHLESLGYATGIDPTGVFEEGNMNGSSLPGPLAAEIRRNKRIKKAETIPVVVPVSKNDERAKKKSKVVLPKHLESLGYATGIDPTGVFEEGNMHGSTLPGPLATEIRRSKRIQKAGLLENIPVVVPAQKLPNGNSPESVFQASINGMENAEENHRPLDGPMEMEDESEKLPDTKSSHPAEKKSKNASPPTKESEGYATGTEPNGGIEGKTNGSALPAAMATEIRRSKRLQNPENIPVVVPAQKLPNGNSPESVFQASINGMENAEENHRPLDGPMEMEDESEKLPDTKSSHLAEKKSKDASPPTKESEECDTGTEPTSGIEGKTNGSALPAAMATEIRRSKRLQNPENIPVVVPEEELPNVHSPESVFQASINGMENAEENHRPLDGPMEMKDESEKLPDTKSSRPAEKNSKDASPTSKESEGYGTGTEPTGGIEGKTNGSALPAAMATEIRRSKRLQNSENIPVVVPEEGLPNVNSPESVFQVSMNGKKNAQEDHGHLDGPMEMEDKLEKLPNTRSSRKRIKSVVQIPEKPKGKAKRRRSSWHPNCSLMLKYQGKGAENLYNWDTVSEEDLKTLMNDVGLKDEIPNETFATVLTSMNDFFEKMLDRLCDETVESLYYGVFSFQAIRSAMIREGVVPSNCDTEVIIEMMKQYFPSEVFRKAQGVLYPKPGESDTEYYFFRN